MNPLDLKSLAERLQDRTLSTDEFVGAVGRLISQKSSPQSVATDAATVDLDRRRRCGFAEVVFGPGKTVEQLEQIVATLVEHDEAVLVTRVNQEQATALLKMYPLGRHN